MYCRKEIVGLYGLYKDYVSIYWTPWISTHCRCPVFEHEKNTLLYICGKKRFYGKKNVFIHKQEKKKYSKEYILIKKMSFNLRKKINFYKNYVLCS